MGAITMAVRERLDNLIFVVNCNLQRLDGPVRGNGKIIQELEAAFRGAGWNVLKVIWGRAGIRCLPKTTRVTCGASWKRRSTASTRITRPRAARTCANISSASTRNCGDGRQHVGRRHLAPEPWRPRPLSRSTPPTTMPFRHRGQPSIILAKTVKGYGMGSAGEGQNVAHQQKKLDLDALKDFRDRFNIPVADKDIEDIPYCKPACRQPRNAIPAAIAANSLADSCRRGERSCRRAGGSDARRLQGAARGHRRARSLHDDGVRADSDLADAGQERSASMWCRSSRTRRAPSAWKDMFRQVGIYSSKGQLYTPQDADQVMYYREDKEGQILEEGINEAGAFCSPGWPQARPTATMTSRRSRSTSITRCSASSASATSSGPAAISRRAAS